MRIVARFDVVHDASARVGRRRGVMSERRQSLRGQVNRTVGHYPPERQLRVYEIRMWSRKCHRVGAMRIREK
jgi:hypothetical protein